MPQPTAWKRITTWCSKQWTRFKTWIGFGQSDAAPSAVDLEPVSPKFSSRKPLALLSQDELSRCEKIISDRVNFAELDAETFQALLDYKNVIHADTEKRAQFQNYIEGQYILHTLRCRPKQEDADILFRFAHDGCDATRIKIEAECFMMRVIAEN